MELARRAGVSPSYVSLIEHGEKIPSEEVAVRIAQALDEREDLYRVWAATARMDAKTREAVLRVRESESALAPLIAGDATALEAALSELGEIPDEQGGRSTLPPPLAADSAGRAAPGGHHARSPMSGVLDEDALAGALLVPLLHAGAAPAEGDLQDDDVDRVLALDGRVLGRGAATGLVAMRVTESNGSRVTTWLRPNDLVVVDRKPARLDSALIHVLRTADRGLVLTRASLAGTTLLALADPSDQAPPEPFDLSEAGIPGPLLFGTVVWSSRRWS